MSPADRATLAIREFCDGICWGPGDCHVEATSIKDCPLYPWRGE